ncbi:4Fe-4S binding protein [Thermoflexus sp.]|uniref:4Fe-4S binding protein n=1 Tax=Thermoflexus sp. TaxID=1969742 RepID=UPI0035E424B1
MKTQAFQTHTPQRSSNGSGPARTAILVCGDLDLDLMALRDRLSSVFPDGVFHVLPHLCERPPNLHAFLQQQRVERLVLGVCHPRISLGLIQAEARKAGVDPLGIEIRALPSGREKARIEQAVLYLVAAAARAQKYSGSHMDQIRPRFARELDRRAMLRLSWLFYEGVPAVDRARCAAEQGCQVCQEVCPYEAWRWVDGWPELDKEACQTCGLCLMACPRGAMVNPAWTPEQFEVEIQTLLDPRVRELSPRGIVFQCWREGGEPIRVHPSWLKVAVPCAGTVPPAWLLAPLILGAGAVRVLPCSNGCAHPFEGRLEGTVRFCQRVLAQMGVREDRVRIGGDLLRPPPEPIGRIEAPGLFFPSGAAKVFRMLAELCQHPELTLTDPFAPLGQVDIDPASCTGCAQCARACPTEAIRLEEETDRLQWTFDMGRCVACEECVRVCPESDRGAIRVIRVVDLERLNGGRTKLHEAKVLRCARCHQPIAAAPLLDWIESRLGKENAALLSYLRQYCPACRQAFMNAGGMSWELDG